MRRLQIMATRIKPQLGLPMLGVVFVSYQMLLFKLVRILNLKKKIYLPCLHPCFFAIVVVDVCHIVAFTLGPVSTVDGCWYLPLFGCLEFLNL